jgi:sugar phosphate isomerase/epimerase
MALASRRQFLASAAACGGAAGLAGVGIPAARAIEPVKRAAPPQFQFSLAAYSYRDWLTGKKGNLTLEDFITDCAKFGLEGTELTSYYFPPSTTPEYLRSIKALCFKEGLDVSGTAIRDELCVPPGEARDTEIAHVKKWIDYAEILGAPVIRIFSGNAKKDQSPEEAHRLAVEGMEECCDYAGKHGVFLALENHGGLTETVDGMLALVRDVKSPWFGVNLDSGNFRSPDPYADLAKIAPYALNVQIKVVIQRGDRTSAQKEPSDFKLLAKMMRDVGYRGYIVLEYEEADDPREACPKYLKELREAFA